MGVTKRASSAGAKAGDLVFYGKRPHAHVAMYMSNDIVLSFRAKGAVIPGSPKQDRLRFQPIDFLKSELLEVDEFRRYDAFLA